MADAAALTARRLAVLAAHIKPRRLARARAVWEARVADTALLLENLSDPVHARAAIRTAEVLGVQRIDVVDQYGLPWSAVGGDQGAAQWVTVNRHASTADALASLRGEGFGIAVGWLGRGSVDLYSAVQRSLVPRDAPAQPSLAPRDAAAQQGGPPQAAAAGFDPAPLAGPRTRPRICIAVGNERRGVSGWLCTRADIRFVIPHLGATESLSVSAATSIALHAFLHRTPDYAGRALRASTLLSALDLEGATDDEADDEAAEAASDPGKSGGSSRVEAERQARLKKRLLAKRAKAAPIDADAEDGAALAKLMEAHAAIPAPVEPAWPWAQPAAGGLGGGLPAGQLVCEGLPRAEVDRLLLSWLMRQVRSSEAVLERAGLRPEDM